MKWLPEAEQNLILSAGQSWRSVRRKIFQVVNGKKLLFENLDSLFQYLKAYKLSMQLTSLELNYKIVTASITIDEIHKDVHQSFNTLSQFLI